MSLVIIDKTLFIIIYYAVMYREYEPRALEGINLSAHDANLFFTDR
jgi:hypothetical protein